MATEEPTEEYLVQFIVSVPEEEEEEQEKDAIASFGAYEELLRMRTGAKLILDSHNRNKPQVQDALSSAQWKIRVLLLNTSKQAKVSDYFHKK